jgi:putative exosortase-associated protein (TIGR04073 family)
MRAFGACSIPVVAIALLVLGGVSDAAAGSAARKAGRGLAAMTTGFLEIPGNMVAETRRRGPAYGMTLGFAKGLGGVVVRELVGVYEFVTAPIAVPEGYRPLLAPEFPWGYFDEREVAASEMPPVAARGRGRAAH